MAIVTTELLTEKLPLIRAAIVDKIRQMLLMERNGIDISEHFKKVKMAISMYDYLNNYDPDDDD